MPGTPSRPGSWKVSTSDDTLEISDTASTVTYKEDKNPRSTPDATIRKRRPLCQNQNTAPPLKGSQRCFLIETRQYQFTRRLDERLSQ
jgi:hypothetical protein